MIFKYSVVILLLLSGGSLFAENAEKDGTEPSGKSLLLGGRLVRLNKNDEKLAQLAGSGKISEAAQFISGNWKDLESCIGFRSIQGQPRRELLKALGESGFINYTNEWDRFEVLLTDPLGHFGKLLPNLKVTDLSNTPPDQVIPLFKRPDFPKSWLKEDTCAWLALLILKANNEDERVLTELLACGVPASSIVKTQVRLANRPVQVVLMKDRTLDKTVALLLKGGHLNLEDPVERLVVFNILIKADDPELWAAASKQKLQWSLEVDEFGHSVERVPSSLKDFSGWIRLHDNLGLDLYHQKIFLTVLNYPILKDNLEQGAEFLRKAGKDYLHKMNDAGLKRLAMTFDSWDPSRSLLAFSHASWVPLLIDMGLDPKARDTDGNTLLHETGDFEQLQRFLELGLDPNARNKAGNTCLFVKRPAKELELLLRAGADPDAKNNQGETALFYQGYAKSMQTLLEAGADPNVISRGGDTVWSSLTFPLVYFSDISIMTEIDGEPVDEPMQDIVDVLLKNKCNPNLRGGNGTTPLMVLARKCRPSLIVELLGAGADKNAVDKAGHNAMDYALTFAKDDPRYLNPDEDVPELETDYWDERVAISLWLLKMAGLTPGVTSTSRGVNPDAWNLWHTLEDAPSLPEHYLRVALRYDSPGLTQQLLETTPAALSMCIDTCSWLSAQSILEKNPKIAQQAPNVFERCLQVMKRKEATTFTGGCARPMGYRQTEFDAFYKHLKALSPEQASK